jgi:hypothetical protein
VSLVHRDPRAGRAIQEPLEVKAGKLIISSLTNMRSEGRDRARITPCGQKIKTVGKAGSYPIPA